MQDLILNKNNILVVVVVFAIWATFEFALEFPLSGSNTSVLFVLGVIINIVIQKFRKKDNDDE